MKFQYVEDQIDQCKLLKQQKESLLKSEQEKLLKAKENAIAPPPDEEVGKILSIEKHQKYKDKIDEQKAKNIKLEFVLKCESEKVPRQDLKEIDYDLTLKLNSFENITTQGIQIEWNKVKYPELDTLVNNFKKQGQIVCVLGNQKVGKTHIFARLFDQKIQAEKLKSEGISIFSKEIQNKNKDEQLNEIERIEYVHGLDIKGFARGLQYYYSDQMDEKIQDTTTIAQMKNRKMLDQIAVKNFIQSYLLEISSIIIIVVGTMNFEDQTLIQQVKQNNKDKKIFVIHNYSDLIREEDIESRCYTDIKTSFVVTQKQGQQYIYVDQEYNLNEQEQKNLQHLIYTQENSPAGEKLNRETINYIKDAMENVAESKPIQLFDNFVGYLNKHIKEYLDFEFNPELKFIFEGSKIALKKIENQLQDALKFEYIPLKFDFCGVKIKQPGKSECFPAYCCFGDKDSYYIFIEFTHYLQNVNKPSYEYIVNTSKKTNQIEIYGQKKWPEEVGEQGNYQFERTIEHGKIQTEISINSSSEKLQKFIEKKKFLVDDSQLKQGIICLQFNKQQKVGAKKVIKKATKK